MRQFALYHTRLMKLWVLTLALLGCEVKEIEPISLRQGTLLGEPVFNAPGEVQTIDVPTYAYTVKPRTVTLRTDSLQRLMPKTNRPNSLDGYTVQLVDAVNDRPLFRWRATGQRLVAMAIFPSRIVVNNNSIVNSAASVWRWDSSFPSGKDGEVSYNDGRRLNPTQKPVYVPEKVPTALPLGRYVWCVWAWDDAGINIRYSSRELPFLVTQ